MDFNSILIGSEDPARLVEYYTQAARGAGFSDGGYSGWQLGSGWVTIGPHSEVHGKNVKPRPDHLEHRVQDVQGDFDRMKAAGAIVVAEPYGFEAPRPTRRSRTLDRDARGPRRQLLPAHEPDGDVGRATSIRPAEHVATARRGGVARSTGRPRPR